MPELLSMKRVAEIEGREKANKVSGGVLTNDEICWIPLETDTELSNLTYTLRWAVGLLREFHKGCFRMQEVENFLKEIDHA